MKYTLVASDFDDSLCPKGQKVSEFTRKVIKKFTEKGGRFVIVTGRMNHSIYPIAKELGLSGEIVSCQGTVIRDIETNQVLKSKKIDRDLAVEYLKEAEKLGLIPQVYKDDCLYTVKENYHIEGYGEFCKVQYEVVDGTLSSEVENRLGDLDMIYLWTSEEKQSEYIKFLQNKFSKRLDITSSTPHNIEAVVYGASKGDALLSLAKHYKIPIRKTMAFGDSLNDKSMIETAGLGVAMENAKDGLEKVADYVCEDTKNDGVAKTIEKFCLKRSMKWQRKRA